MQYPVNDQEPNADVRDDLMGRTIVAERPKKLFEGISLAQVIAASAAAATSMLLASKIGIAGSVIGAAVSSMVTVICSQLYRNALDASAQKLKRMQGTMDYPTARDGSHAISDSKQTPYSTELRPGARVAPTKLLARAAAERSANARKVAFASAGIAVLAVALCAGVILLSTAGEGLGAKAEPLFTPSPTEPAGTDPSSAEQSPAPNPSVPDTGENSNIGGSSQNDSNGSSQPQAPSGQNQQTDADAPSGSNPDGSSDSTEDSADQPTENAEADAAPSTPGADSADQNSQAPQPAA